MPSRVRGAPPESETQDPTPQAKARRRRDAASDRVLSFSTLASSRTREGARVVVLCFGEEVFLVVPSRVGGRSSVIVDALSPTCRERGASALSLKAFWRKESRSLYRFRRFPSTREGGATSFCVSARRSEEVVLVVPSRVGGRSLVIVDALAPTSRERGASALSLGFLADVGGH